MAKKLFGGKETYSEELKEAKAVKSGRISPAGFARGEKSEGHKDEEKNPLKLGKDIKSGKLSPEAYAKKESKEVTKMTRGGGVARKGVGRGTVVTMSKGGAINGCATKGRTRGKIV